MNFLSEEYVLRRKVGTFEEFADLVSEMQQRGSISVALPTGANNSSGHSHSVLSPASIVRVTDERLINFLGSLVWPLVDSYWAAISYLFTLQTRVDAIPLD